MDGRAETAISRGEGKGAAADAVVPDNVCADNPERERTANEHNEHGVDEVPPTWEDAKTEYYRHRRKLLLLFGVPESVVKSKHSEGVKKGENSHATKKS